MTEKVITESINQDYKYGFVTDIEQEKIPPGLNEQVVKIISDKKNEPNWLYQWRLKAYRHWLKMTEPKWAKVGYPKINYDDISYFAAPKKKLKSLDEVDPELLDTYNKLGIPIQEQKNVSRRCCRCCI